MNNENYCIGYLLPHPPAIVPDVGSGMEADALLTINSMKKVANEIEHLKPDTIVLISPHAPLFSDYIYFYDSPILQGGLKKFGSNMNLSFNQDSELLIEIESLMKSNNIKGGRLKNCEIPNNNFDLDHGSVVPLYFIGHENKNFKIVVMSTSGHNIEKLYKTGQIIRQASENLNKKVIVVASGDMSHMVNEKSPYGICAEGKIFDDLVVDILKSGHLNKLLSIDQNLLEKASECGYRPLVILCGVFDEQKTNVNVLSYEAPFGIGYCVASFKAVNDEINAIEQKYSKRESEYVKVARQSLESYIKNGKIISVKDYKDILSKHFFTDKACVFVSLKKFGELRGCIGTIAPTTSCLAEEIIQNAIGAGTKDPRFNAVTPDELDDLDYSVDVLGNSQSVASKNELDPKVYGVIVSKGQHRGLLLPDLEGVDSVDHQLEIACMKGGIDPNEKYDIFKFSVSRYK